MYEAISAIHLQRLRQLEDAFGLGDIETSIAELSEVLFCSTRNVTKVMKKLHALGLIHWVAGRGRGIKSHFSIVVKFEELLTLQVLSKVQAGSLNDAYQFAETFHYQGWFRKNLPKWLETYSESNENSDQVIFIVPHALERCHPVDLFDIHSGLYATVLFDTLINFDPLTDSFTPHLAHQFQKTDFGFAFRIRPNVHFHNGVLLTPQLVREHFLKLKDYNDLYRQLLASIESIEVNRQWVEIRMRYDDPMLLHLLSDVHFSVILNNEIEEGFPIGTGSYSWDTRNESSWSLVKNERYFGVHGILSRADFWRLDSAEAQLNPYVIRYESINTPKSFSSEDIPINGCNALCFHQRLPKNMRKVLVYLFKHKIKRAPNTSKNPCTTLIGYGEALELQALTPLSDEQIVESLEFTTLRYFIEDSEVLQPALEHLNHLGIETIPVNSIEAADFWVGDYSFGNNVTIGQYYWLLCSDYAQLMLPVTTIQRWKNQMLLSQSLPDFFYQLEQHCIDEYRVLPLWRKSTRYNCHSSIRGHRPNNFGLFNLAEIWLDKR
ncbi:SgrR family transcriptional regulator (plasmid) [Vibrio pelagius]|uniref:SgrR family transcriptional regulator n=1 Tax=Vibrio pelagius TaxID=28169 RepID=A0ABY5GAR7_VIBPE|nr:SgrR family transcriptional regulator [Vibrio pelagius]UTT87272.1 SgrR family transcriptional regulator [Vibrio pelagius]